MANNSIKIVGFIPARAQSTRFPGKPLADINGKPMVVRVFERVSRSPILDDVCIATDSKHILEAARQGGARAIMTSRDHPTGTDRVAEAARTLGLGGDDIAVNIQGDQPLMDPVMIEEVVGPLLADPTIPMSTLIYRIIREEEVTHPNAVKTTVDKEGFALYFSRATIPFARDQAAMPTYYKHHGIYAYRNNFLQLFSRLPQGVLELMEHLEQLRAMEHGFRVRCVITDKDSIEVDTLEDLQRVRDELTKEDLTRSNG
jgi:3-deoxy-manno-octulosonate cytidylyltransferase (CMP-KDO synthetase)